MAVSFAYAIKVPYTPKRSATTAYNLIFSKGYFTHACRFWNEIQWSTKLGKVINPFLPTSIVYGRKHSRRCSVAFIPQEMLLSGSQTRLPASYHCLIPNFQKPRYILQPCHQPHHQHCLPHERTIIGQQKPCGCPKIKWLPWTTSWTVLYRWSHMRKTVTGGSLTSKNYCWLCGYDARHPSF